MAIEDNKSLNLDNQSARDIAMKVVVNIDPKRNAEGDQALIVSVTDDRVVVEAGGYDGVEHSAWNLSGDDGGGAILDAIDEEAGCEAFLREYRDAEDGEAAQSILERSLNRRQ